MSHRAKVCAVYKINQDEMIHVSVGVALSFPDALAEARATAVAGIRDILDDIYARERVTTEPDPA